jgi:aminopeptidase N
MSGMVFVSEAWFRIWNGTPNHWLTIITVHEVAHQWWYVRVANDQSNAPYLDESLATYSELLYFERYQPDLVEEWWNFRVFQYSTDAPVDSTVYEYTQWRPYINAVYLRGVKMLQAIRDVVGDEAFMAWLLDYSTINEGRIALPIDFWRSLPEAEYLEITEIRREYLRNGDVLGVQE